MTPIKVLNTRENATDLRQVTKPYIVKVNGVVGRSENGKIRRFVTEDGAYAFGLAIINGYANQRVG